MIEGFLDTGFCGALKYDCARELRLSLTPEILLQLSSMELGLWGSLISELFLEVGGVANEAPELFRESAGEGITEAGESSLEFTEFRSIRLLDDVRPALLVSKLESDIFRFVFGRLSVIVLAGSEFLFVCLSALKKSAARFFILSFT